MSTKWKREGTCLVVDEARNSICIVSSTAANARLIAAAPELLSVCEILLKIIRPQGNAEITHLRDLAKAAIAKAETPA